MFTVYDTPFGSIGIDYSDNTAVRPGLLFDPPTWGFFYPETKEIIWTADVCYSYDVIMRYPHVKTLGTVLNGHQQDSRFLGLAKQAVAHPLPPDCLFWWNHWNEFNKLTQGSAVCYVVVEAQVAAAGGLQ